ncbi:hypothetical protein PENSPDRAFT_573940 [Peniophora sp. CONT]|nr:hypothetical protein PENSPDRAFT_573940 [Peniophora sp. CONT]
MLRVHPPPQCHRPKAASRPAPLVPTSRGRFTARQAEDADRLSAPPEVPQQPQHPVNSLPHLRAELSKIDSTLAQLVRERAALSSSLEAAARASVPVARLPSELLSAIFILAAVDDAPLHFMLVCRHWAALAQETPALWARIRIGPHHPLSRARVRLTRSKMVPLDLSVAFDRRNEPTTETAVALTAALQTLTPHISRWRSFRLSVPSRAHAQLALALCRAPAPLLETLHIRVADTYTAEELEGTATSPLLLFGGHTPRLVECSMHGWTLGRLRGLRRLELAGYWDGAAPSAGELLEVLRACPKLETLALRNMSDLELDDPAALDGPSAVPSISLPRLRRITLSYAGGLRARAVLDQLSMPALEDIELCYLDSIGPVLQHLTAQAVTGLPLTRLHIENCSFREQDLLSLLYRLSVLSVLELVDVHDVGSGILQSLAVPVNQAWACPNLDTLCLDGCSSFDFASLRACVEARLAPDVRAFPGPRPSKTSPPSAPTSSTSSESVALTRYPRRPSVATNGRSHSAPPDGAGTWTWPSRLRRVSLTRCEQLSVEMLGWLRVYVPEVTPAPTSY